MKKRFTLPVTIDLVEPKSGSTPLVKPAPPIAEKVVKPEVKASPEKKSVNPAATVAVKNIEKPVVAERVVVKENEQVLNAPLTIEPTAGQRKWQKFKKDPRLFFAHSKYTFLRPLKYLFRG